MKKALINALRIYYGYKFLMSLKGCNNFLAISNALKNIAGEGNNKLDTIDGVNIYYNPYSMLLVGYPDGIAFTINFGSPTIIVGRKFLVMSKDAQEFTIAHELGHLYCRHVADFTYPVQRELKILKGEVLSIELEADAYAVKKIGMKRALNALDEISKAVRGIARKEVMLRIEHINKH